MERTSDPVPSRKHFGKFGIPAGSSGTESQRIGSHTNLTDPTASHPPHRPRFRLQVRQPQSLFGAMSAALAVKIKFTQCRERVPSCSTQGADPSRSCELVAVDVG